MSRRLIEQRARLVVARELCVTPAKITDQADFRDQLGADSLDLVTLTSALEEEFKIQVTDDDAEFCETFGTAVDLIEAKLEQRGLNGKAVA